MTAPTGRAVLADAITDQTTLDLLLQTGTVLAVNGDGTLSVDLAGAPLTLPKLNSYVPGVGDAVTVVNAGGKRLVLGRAGAYVGAAGAAVTVQSATQTAYVTTASTTFAPLAGDPNVVFVAPPSGKVLVSISSALTGEAAGIGAAATFDIGTGSVVGAGAIVHAPTDEDQLAASTNIAIEAGKTTMVGGLTPGATYWARMLYARVGASSVGGFSRRRIMVSPTV